VTRPEVSVVLPTFNRLEYLRPAIDSIFAQTFTDWELIVADDGSERETAAYLSALEGSPRIRVLRLAHTGNPGAVRNAGWQAAQGNHIAFLDSDDVWLPEKLALQIGSLRSHPGRGWGHTAFAVIDESGARLAGKRARAWPAREGWILEQLITMEAVIAAPTVIVRKSLLERVGGFDVGQRMCEDYDLWLRLAAVSEIDGVPETMSFVRSHRNHFHREPIVLEDRGRALEKMLRASSGHALHAMLRRERAKVAAGLARSQVFHGSRWSALRTLAQSSSYSWEYPEWWFGGARAAVRAVTPAPVVRLARSLLGRDRS